MKFRMFSNIFVILILLQFSTELRGYESGNYKNSESDPAANIKPQNQLNPSTTDVNEGDFEFQFIVDLIKNKEFIKVDEELNKLQNFQINSIVYQIYQNKSENLVLLIRYLFVSNNLKLEYRYEMLNELISEMVSYNDLNLFNLLDMFVILEFKIIQEAENYSAVYLETTKLLKKLRQIIINTGSEYFKNQIKNPKLNNFGNNLIILNKLVNLDDNTIFNEMIRKILNELPRTREIKKFIELIDANGLTTKILDILKEKLVEEKLSYQLLITQIINDPETDTIMRELLPFVDQQPKLLHDSSATPMLIQFQKDKSFLSSDSQDKNVYASNQNDNHKIKFLTKGIKSYEPYSYVFHKYDTNKFLKVNDYENSLILSEDGDFTATWVVIMNENDTITLQNWNTYNYLCRNETTLNGIALLRNPDDISFCLFKLFKFDEVPEISETKQNKDNSEITQLNPSYEENFNEYIEFFNEFIQNNDQSDNDIKTLLIKMMNAESPNTFLQIEIYKILQDIIISQADNDSEMEQNALKLKEKLFQIFKEYFILNLKIQVDSRSFDPYTSNPNLINLLKIVNEETLYLEVISEIFYQLSLNQITRLIKFINANNQISYILSLLNEKLTQKNNYQLAIAEAIFDEKADREIYQLLPFVDLQVKLLYNETIGPVLIQFQKDDSYLNYDLNSKSVFAGNEQPMWIPKKYKSFEFTFHIETYNYWKFVKSNNYENENGLMLDEDPDRSSLWSIKFKNGTLAFKNIQNLKYICRDESTTFGIVLLSNYSASCEIKLIQINDFEK